MRLLSASDWEAGGFQVTQGVPPIGYKADGTPLFARWQVTINPRFDARQSDSDILEDV